MKNKKCIVFTAIFCIAFALVVTITAASYIKTIEVSTDIKLNIKGQNFIPKDADGNPVEVFVYNGTTYVPIRAVAEAFDLDVSYDSNTKTAIISEKTAQKTNSDTVETSSNNENINVTIGQKNALKSAKQYLELMAFSYSGLIKQLEYEKYSHDDAVYAVDNCGADWNEQAAKSAKAYLELMAFSRDGLIKQLEYEGFTHEQAVYGAEANGY